MKKKYALVLAAVIWMGMTENLKASDSSETKQSDTHDIQLEFTGKTISADEITAFAQLNLNDMVAKLRSDYGIQVLFVSKKHPQLKPDPTLKTDNLKVAIPAANYYSQNEDIKALFEDYSALFIRPYHHFKHQSEQMERPYLSEPLLLVAPFVLKNTLVHSFIHILIYRAALKDKSQVISVDHVEHSAQCGKLFLFLQSYGVKQDKQMEYDEAKKLESITPEILAEKRGDAFQSLLSHYLYNLEYIVESTGEEMDTFSTLYAVGTSAQWPSPEMKVILNRIEALTKELLGLLGPMSRDYGFKSYQKDRLSFTPPIQDSLTKLETLESLLRTKQQKLQDWVTLEKSKFK